MVQEHYSLTNQFHSFEKVNHVDPEKLPQVHVFKNTHNAKDFLENL
jgi:hypothetical protein